MSSTKNPVLLGEAPKGTQGFAFDWNAWTTMRFAEAVGFNARFIFKYFRPLNLLDDRQETGTNSYDALDHQRAVQNVGLKIAAGDRVICVGSRVTRAVSEYFGNSSCLFEGFKLLNKAVELDARSHLTYRAYWYFQNRNYKMCINDLERYYIKLKKMEFKVNLGMVVIMF